MGQNGCAEDTFGPSVCFGTHPQKEVARKGERMGVVIHNPSRAGSMTRRRFLAVSGLSLAGFAAGCAVNPVTGERQVMLVSEAQELELDRKSSPHQFSADYGPVSDRALNDYLNRTGKALASRSHRPQMPYSFRVVRATYVNAYAFPGGSIAATRGILLALGNEAQLAALLGHEIGHVNARHTASRMSKGMLTSLAMAGVMGVVRVGAGKLAPLAAGLGGIGAGLLLARYSRQDERQADALGMEYMVRAGYSPRGMVGLMEVLRSLSKHKPDAIEMMFATHPMSDERYRTAVERSETRYRSSLGLPLYRERYMDHTAGLRKLRGAIEQMQKAERLMGRRKFQEAEDALKKALREAPSDYAGLLMMAKCRLVLKQYPEAERFAAEARAVDPEEPQALHVEGIAMIRGKKFTKAYEAFQEYEKLLPGNPNTIFLKGLSLEGMGRKKEAARAYSRYLDYDRQSKQARYAYGRLVEWGYIKPTRR